MSGIIFLGTRDLEAILKFYEREIGAWIWLRQADCVVLEHGNMLFGFCQRDRCDLGGILTFFYPTQEDVDARYHRFRDRAVEVPRVNGKHGTAAPGVNEKYGTVPPGINEKYGIYHFFATDPEGRTIEFQHFLDPRLRHPGGIELLTTRRSVRHFLDREVPDDLLGSIFSTCRFSPTSCNSESYYFLVIRDPEIREFLASRRGSSSAPIGRSPIAIAICSDPEMSRRPVQDACIAGYHFLLACWNSGVGTCWVAAMDRDDVKDRIGVPRGHYVATVTPVGFPAGVPNTPERRSVEEMVHHR